MINDNLFYDSHEIIGGKKFMSPSANPSHNKILYNIALHLGIYFLEKKCGHVFTDSVDVHLPDGNVFKPDLVVITSEHAGIINWNKAIYGVPDMVVEVLSRSTRKRDLTVKKDSYENCGVKEYWIIDPFMQAVDVYILREGKFEFDNEYIRYDDYEFQNLNDEEKAAAKFEIPVSLFKDFKIKLDDIFSWS